VAWVADQQLGLITTQQLEAAGVGRGAIAARRARQVLRPVHRGVYVVGHSTPLPGARALSAVLACRVRAYVSHTAAAGLWGLIGEDSREVEITVPGRNCRSRAGIIVHKTRVLHPRDRTTRFGIPITAPARTLIDHAASSDYEEAEAEAIALRLLTEPQLTAACDRAPHRAGVALVRAILGQPAGPRRPRSGGERAMLRLIRAGGIAGAADQPPGGGLQCRLLLARGGTDRRGRRR
jgi:predicted transcriptional regulator of viral defense system